MAPTRREATKALYKYVIQLARQGFNNREIAAKAARNVSTVSRILAEARSLGDFRGAEPRDVRSRFPVGGMMYYVRPNNRGERYYRVTSYLNETDGEDCYVMFTETDRLGKPLKGGTVKKALKVKTLAPVNKNYYRPYTPPHAELAMEIPANGGSSMAGVVSSVDLFVRLADLKFALLRIERKIDRAFSSPAVSEETPPQEGTGHA